MTHHAILAFCRSELLPLLALDAALWLWVWVVPTLVLPCRFLPGGILGLALPGLVLVRRETYTWRVLRHELHHVRQMRRWSPLGIGLAQLHRYALLPFCTLARRRRWPGLGELYWANPLERSAFMAMDRDDPLPRHWGCRPEA
jgi:hypothetical protein